MESFVLFLPFLLIMGGFMYFASRRQRRAMQATIDLHDSLQPGERVHTTSGLEATIVAIADDTIDLEIAPGVVTTWMKLAIRDRILPDDDIDEELNEDLDKDVDDVAGEPPGDQRFLTGNRPTGTDEPLARRAPARHVGSVGGRKLILEEIQGTWHRLRRRCTLPVTCRCSW
ncbi:preprotein translocase subunit YajC [Mycobacterium tuberculosis RGTB423]|nr:preprotein translocase subunit YajC [Mycobacterium tuberculosis RGTB423]